jgi:hypothetical protein
VDSIANEVRFCSSLHEVEDLLRIEVKIARIQLDEVDRRFWRISADISDPHHGEKVEFGAGVQCAARSSLLVALKRLNGFLVHATVPADFRLRQPATEMYKAQAA